MLCIFSRHFILSDNSVNKVVYTRELLSVKAEKYFDALIKQLILILFTAKG